MVPTNYEVLGRAVFQVPRKKRELDIGIDLETEAQGG